MTMRLDSFDMEKYEGKKIPSPGCCIYCGDDQSKLTDEHVIPYALGGNSSILLKACCPTCQCVIQKYEQRVLRDQMGVFRARIGSPTRNRKNRPTHSKMHFVEVDNKGQYLRDIGDRMIPINDAPLAFAVWDLAPARILDRTSAAEAHAGKPWPYIDMNAAMRLAAEIAAETGCDHAAVRVQKIVRNDYLRLIAKIAHAYAVAEIGLGKFRPLLTSLILDKSDDFDEWVGRDPTPGPSDANAHSMVTISAGNVSNGPAKGYTAVRLQLYPILGTPAHAVIVGAPL